MRILLIAKALQAALAAFGIFLLLFVDELCHLQEPQMTADNENSLEQTRTENLRSGKPATTALPKYTELHSSAKVVTTNTESAHEAAIADKSRTGEAIKKVTDKISRKAAKRIRLLDKTYYCLPIGGRDILGIGGIDMPYGATFRIPFVCLILNIVIACYNITLNITLWKPRRVSQAMLRFRCDQNMKVVF
ncbi:hypothetical protein KIN20_010985 [Parelaphostrongylus tenuis]|uniref:Uncharacterized protein n=1 Tax=Parelaphostrongylus tenuis TaxID=148309 RepID=A0AAD5M8Q6_PARTN|nr:hypothetical protein KIN20_010985 [Parelaphostrongylus tenuis]